MSELTYTPPVDRLLTYRDCRLLDAERWPDYVGDLELTADHIPELIQMLTDEALWSAKAEDLACWAPIHAWRALGQLRADAAIAPLVVVCEQQEDLDWVIEEVPEVFAMIGPTAIPALAEFLLDPTREGWPKVNVANSLRAIAVAHPSTQADCIEAVMQTLAGFADQEDHLNGVLTRVLVELKVVEAAPLIEQVYAEGPVDEMCAGSWPAIQVEFGLKSKSDFAPEELRPNLPEGLAEMRETLLELEKNLPPGQTLIDVLLGSSRTDRQLPDFKGAAIAQSQHQHHKPSQGFAQNQSSARKKRKKKKKK